MKVVILAGGLGSRLSEETDIKPKPMVTIGGRPILWHIMKYYATFGFLEFVICLGYRGYVIKEYFANYFLHSSDVTFDLARNHMTVHQNTTEPWSVTLVDTGMETLTGGRVRRVRDHLGDQPFMLTYGDGLSDVDLAALLAFHRTHGKVATVTASQPPGRFGALHLAENGRVEAFSEKPAGDGGWINGGFFVMEPSVFEFIAGDDTSLEVDVLADLARCEQLAAFQHPGFWLPMDTLRDRNLLEDLWNKGQAPWQVWDSPKPVRMP